MLTFNNKYMNNRFSQNGEDGIIAECLHRMNIETGTCAEWGAHNGVWCSNTAALIEKGWAGFLMEADYYLFLECKGRHQYNDKVRLGLISVTNKNVNDIIDKEYDLISIDTDGGNDYQCFRSMKHIPKILIIEINSSFPPGVWHVSEEKGASYKAMVVLGIEKGYFLLCHTGNLIFVRNEYLELFPEIVGDGLSNSELYFNKSWL